MTPRLPMWKRAEDLLVAVPCSIVAIPLFAVIGAAIVLESGRPVFFTDERVGAGGRPFRMVKFRTMVPGAIDRGLGIQASAKDPRITRVGTFLRRWSVDELPQILNVVRGDMSIVGPRPTYASQVDRYTPAHRGRLAVKPGITGLAQVSGRNDLTWSQRIDRDLEYIARLSPWLDVTILLRTPIVILRGIGLYGRHGITPDYDPTER
jgi:lipopolysaccharide/colanic/teichoic acid biosynthesis glycosyltransferase